MTTGSEESRLDYAELKNGGFIKQTQANLFTVRLRCPGGKVTSRQLHTAAELAEKYGNGEVHASVRQSIEIPYIHYRHFNEVTAALRAVDWSVASCGSRFRVPTACGGCRYNPNGLMDTRAVCDEVDKRYFGTATGHHKFKITFSGCPIDCARSRGADLGFQGSVEPEPAAESCTGCGLCAASCDEGAITIDGGRPQLDKSKCLYCGDCIKVCPSDAMTARHRGWLVRAGGHHGRHPVTSYEVARFASDEQCYAIIENTLAWYGRNASGRERFGNTLLRIGLEAYLEEVIRPLGVDVIETPAEREKFRVRGNDYRSA